MISHLVICEMAIEREKQLTMIFILVLISRVVTTSCGNVYWVNNITFHGHVKPFTQENNNKEPIYPHVSIRSILFL